MFLCRVSRSPYSFSCISDLASTRPPPSAVGGSCSPGGCAVWSVPLLHRGKQGVARGRIAYHTTNEGQCMLQVLWKSSFTTTVNKMQVKAVIKDGWSVVRVLSWSQCIRKQGPALLLEKGTVSGVKGQHSCWKRGLSGVKGQHSCWKRGLYQQSRAAFLWRFRE